MEEKPTKKVYIAGASNNKWKTEKKEAEEDYDHEDDDGYYNNSG